MATKSAPINMRVEPSVRNIIDAAANLLQVDRTVFIQRVALREAQRVLANRRDYLLDSKAFEAFDQALAEPTTINPGMSDLLERTSPWE